MQIYLQQKDKLQFPNIQGKKPFIFNNIENHTMVYRAGYILAFMVIFLVPVQLCAQISPDNELFIKHISDKTHPEKLYHKAVTPDLNIIHTTMDYTLDPNVYAISGSVTHQFLVSSEMQAITLRLAQELSPSSVTSSTGEVTVNHSGYELELTFSALLQPGNQYEVTINYSGTPPDNGYFLQAVENGIPVLATFAEPYGAGDWWPCNQGLSDKVDSLDIILTIPQQYSAGANGLLISDIDNGDATHTMHFQHRYPVVDYNVAFAISDYVEYRDEVVLNDKTFYIENLAWEEDLWIAQNNTVNLPPVFEMLSDYFGEYPFADEKYGHMQWPRGGAMEHQTMTSTCCWHYELLVHELGHQWFGNMVTLNSWHDIFLNEGFATYVSGLAYEALFPETEYWEIWKTQKRDHIITEPNGSLYVEDTTDIDRIFDARLSYNKGAMVLHMLRSVVGDENFFQGVNNYLYHPDNLFGFASMETFIESMESAADTTLTEFFNDWYYGEGYPTYTIQYTPGCSALFAVTLRQTTSHSSVDFFEMPVSLHLISSYADTVITLNNTENNQYFLIPLEFCVEEVEFDPEINLVAGPPTFIAGIADNDISRNVTISPNPMKENTLISWGESSFNMLNIYTTDSRLVYHQKIDKQARELRFTDSSPGSGMYIFELVSDEYSVKKKVIIK